MMSPLLNKKYNPYICVQHKYMIDVTLQAWTTENLINEAGFTAPTCVVVVNEELHLKCLSMVLGNRHRAGQLWITCITVHICSREHQRQSLQYITCLNGVAQSLRDREKDREGREIEGGGGVERESGSRVDKSELLRETDGERERAN